MERYWKSNSCLSSVSICLYSISPRTARVSLKESVKWWLARRHSARGHPAKQSPGEKPDYPAYAVDVQFNDQKYLFPWCNRVLRVSNRNMFPENLVQACFQQVTPMGLFLSYPSVPMTHWDFIFSNDTRNEISPSKFGSRKLTCGWWDFRWFLSLGPCQIHVVIDSSLLVYALPLTEKSKRLLTWSILLVCILESHVILVKNLVFLQMQGNGQNSCPSLPFHPWHDDHRCLTHTMVASPPRTGTFSEHH